MKTILTNAKTKFLTVLGALFMAFEGMAQTNGIDSAAAELTTYVDSISNFILIVGAVVGLIGGVRVYIKWNNGDQDINKAIMSWFGSCIFLVLVGGIIRAFFL
jgi:hypothetical protein